jgi:hypothetical protein
MNAARASRTALRPGRVAGAIGAGYPVRAVAE